MGVPNPVPSVAPPVKPVLGDAMPAVSGKSIPKIPGTVLLPQNFPKSRPSPAEPERLSASNAWDLSAK